jgi:POT family proton-dependent oligopeptide transporter
MARHKYATTPPNIKTMPPGVPYIIGNEAAERFSFYGMRSILIIFMTQYLMNSSGVRDTMSESQATGWFHQFVAAVYFLPILGAILADGFWGKYRTIFYLSIVYCMGHLALALNDTRIGLALGLMLIAFGAGGIKPCVSANVGDQFGNSNKHLLSKVFGWFYFSINAGSAVSIYLCPILLNNPNWGPHYAFGLPGLLMFLATVIFWMGRKKFVHIPPARSQFFKQFASREGMSALGRLAIIYAFVVVFWALWDQSSGGAWTLQARHLDLNFLGLTLFPEQVQVANGLLVLAMIPLFNYVLYPLFSRVFLLTPLRKIGIGLFLTSLSFVVIWGIQLSIEGGGKPSVWWQMLAYFILTAGEVMVSITGLEFSYTQAPNKMKSAVMALWLFVVFLGNELVALLNLIVIPWLRNYGMPMETASSSYFRFFVLLMLATAVVYIFVARHYREKTYLQSQEEPVDETVVSPVLAAGTPT